MDQTDLCAVTGSYLLTTSLWLMAFKVKVQLYTGVHLWCVCADYKYHFYSDSKVKDFMVGVM